MGIFVILALIEYIISDFIDYIFNITGCSLGDIFFKDKTGNKKG